MAELERTCSICKHSVDKNGGVFAAGDRAYCKHEFVAIEPEPVACESQRFNPHGVCGTAGALWEPRA